MQEHLFIKIKKTYYIITEIMQKHAKKYGINHIQLSIILLASNKDVNVSTLAATLDITKSAVSQAITGLLVKRLVTRQVDLEDKKIYYIRPTKKALEIKNDIYNCNEEKCQILLKEMTIEEITQMDLLINKFNSILRNF
jgi:DNA-binding MarR family transcriptional regulator